MSIIPSSKLKKNLLKCLLYQFSRKKQYNYRFKESQVKKLWKINTNTFITALEFSKYKIKKDSSVPEEHQAFIWLKWFFSLFTQMIQNFGFSKTKKVFIMLYKNVLLSKRLKKDMEIRLCMKIWLLDRWKEVIQCIYQNIIVFKI